MTTLITTRLRLEPFKSSHLEELYYLNSDSNVMKYITGRPLTLDETLQHMDLVKKNWADLGFSSWSMMDKETNDYIGTCGIQHIEFNPDNPLEFGWRLKPDKRKRGYATEAAHAMKKFIFETTRINELFALCHQENGASERVMQRVGMQYDGIEHWYGLDLVVYKISRSNFEQNRSDAAQELMEASA
jgi:RimJ/RimL family protein N-acetyltransferase